MKSHTPTSVAIVDMAAKNGHVQSLDGLRAISILLVLFGHFLLPPRVAGISGFGVTIFFFISGFPYYGCFLQRSKPMVKLTSRVFI